MYGVLQCCVKVGRQFYCDCYWFGCDDELVCQCGNFERVVQCWYQMYVFYEGSLGIGGSGWSYWLVGKVEVEVGWFDGQVDCFFDCFFCVWVVFICCM